MADTHFSNLIGTKRVIDETLGVQPVEPPITGDFYWESANNRMAYYNSNQWVYFNYTTTTSTSSSTTTTSTSTTTTSTSSSTTTSTSTSTTTSTTTTL
jgi:hypothetical protein